MRTKCSLANKNPIKLRELQNLSQQNKFGAHQLQSSVTFTNPTVQCYTDPVGLVNCSSSDCCRAASTATLLYLSFFFFFGAVFLLSIRLNVIAVVAFFQLASIHNSNARNTFSK